MPTLLPSARESAVAVGWAVGYLALVTVVGLGAAPMEGLGVGGGSLVDILRNNLAVLLLALVVGWARGRALGTGERAIVLAIVLAVVVRFALAHAPILGGLVAAEGPTVLLALAPHALLELACMALLAGAPRLWASATAGVVLAATIEVWVAPGWSALLGV